MNLPNVPALEHVDFDLNILLEVFRYIVFVWNNTSVVFFDWLYTPVIDIVTDATTDYPLLDAAISLLTPLFEQIFGPDFSFLALLSGSFIMVTILMLFISVVVGWVKLLLPTD